MPLPAMIKVSGRLSGKSRSRGHAWGWARALSGPVAGWHAEEPMSQAGGSREAWAPWPRGAAWIGGEYCPVEEAEISVLSLHFGLVCIR